jgi:hypothetical protein
VRARAVRLVGPARAWWAAAGRRERAVGSVAAVAGAALLGAFLFGAWHVLFGGFVRGNWRAGGFGLALAAVTGLLLVLETALVRRRRRA